MLFNSGYFIGFLFAVFLIYYLPAFRKYQVAVLIAASFLFYCYASPFFLSLLVTSILINSVSIYMANLSHSIKAQRTLLSLGIIINILMLIFFKYGALLLKTFSVDKSVFEWLINLPLPLGISFYTFQGISLLVETMKDNSGESGFMKTACYLSFFPNSVSGPIIRFADFSVQIKEKYFGDIKWQDCGKLLLMGYFLKIVIADNLQNYTFWMQYPYFKSYSPIQLWIMMIGYSVQIFADFAGYSFIAQGIALLFGYSLPQNFNFPYISESFGEFWRRWHMSLSNWLKEYLYIPLGGNRRGRLRTYLNLFAVMLVGGIWHGADWKFILWGAAHGLLLVLERIRGYSAKDKERIYKKSFRFVSVVGVFLTVSWLWLFFKLDSLKSIVAYTKWMLCGWQNWMAINVDVCVFILVYTIPIIVYHAMYKGNIPERWRQICKMIFYPLMIFSLIFNRGTSDAFIYFQF